MVQLSSDCAYVAAWFSGFSGQQHSLDNKVGGVQGFF